MTMVAGAPLAPNPPLPVTCHWFCPPPYLPEYLALNWVQDGATPVPSSLPSRKTPLVSWRLPDESWFMLVTCRMTPALVTVLPVPVAAPPVRAMTPFWNVRTLPP